MKTVEFDGACPFLRCQVTVSHSHPVCPECGAVDCGNLFCKGCRSQWGEVWGAEREAKYGARLDARFRPPLGVHDIAPFLKQFAQG